MSRLENSLHDFIYWNKNDMKTVSNPIGSNGFGSQFRIIICSAILAEFMGMEFKYTTFKIMSHNYYYSSDFLEKKEELINFKNNFELSEKETNTFSLNLVVDLTNELLFKAQQSEIFKKIKRVFRENKPYPSSYFGNYFSKEYNGVNVAVHIRRLNIHDNKLIDICSDYVYQNIINDIRKKYNNCKIYIYSQGPTGTWGEHQDEFDMYKFQDTVIHLNDPVEFVFSSFVFADVLVVSSSLSYTAALLSDGEIYYIPNNSLPSMPHWTLLPYKYNISLKYNDYNPNMFLENRSNPCPLFPLRPLIIKEMDEMENIIKNSGLSLVDGKIKIPSNIKHVKIDVGLSYYAPMSQNWLKHNGLHIEEGKEEGNLLVFGFEPNPKSIDRIKDPENDNENKTKEHGAAPTSSGAPKSAALEHKYIQNNQFYVLPIALGNENKLIDFYVTMDAGCSSIYRPKEILLKKVDHVIKTNMFKLKEFLVYFPWDQFEYIEYLKIDAQGSDLDIVKGLEDYIYKFVYITLEPEDIVTYYGSENNSRTNIDEYMASKNFIKVKHYNTCDPTFINSKYKHLLENIYIYQYG